MAADEPGFTGSLTGQLHILSVFDVVHLNFSSRAQQGGPLPSALQGTRDRAGCWAGGEKLIEEVAHYCSMVCLSQRWPADMCRAAGLFWYYLIIHTEKYLHKSIQMDHFASLNVKISTRVCTVTARQSLLRFDAKQEARVSLIIT